MILILDSNSFKITSKQLIFILIGAQVGTGFFSLPRLTSAQAGQNAWISVLLGAFIPLISILLTERALRSFPDSNLVEVTYKLLGKWIGSLLIFLFIIYLIYYSSVVVRMFAEMVSVYMLITTPVAVITFFIIANAGYLISKGAKIVGRANEILFYLSVLSLSLIIFSVSTGEITNLLPLGQISPAALLHGTFNSVYSYSGAEVFLVYYFFTTKKNQALRSGKIAVVIVTITYVLVTLIALFVLGAEYMQRFLWPVLGLLKVTEFDVFQRIEFFLLASWLGIAATPAYSLGLVANVLTLNLFKLDLIRNYTVSVIIISIIIFFLANLPDNTSEVFVFARYAGYSSFFAAWIFPALLCIAILVRGKKVKND